MIIAIDKRGSVNLPVSLRKELGLKSGDRLDLSLAEGGIIVLQPVAIYPTAKVSEKGLNRLKEARESEAGELPAWLVGEMENAQTDSKQEAS